MKKFGAALAAATFVLFAGAANASIHITGVASDTTTLPTKVVDFDNLNAVGYTWVTAPQPGSLPDIDSVRKAPDGDISAYGYVTRDTTAELSTPLLNAISIYIGTVDTYNILEFLYNGDVVGIYDGSTLASEAGIQPIGAYSATYTATFDGTAVNGIRFLTTDNSFEFDNIAVSAAPEASVWAMLLVGFGLTGLFLRTSARKMEGAVA